MSDFNILFRSIHGEQKTKKKADQEDSSTETKTETKPDAPVNPIKAFFARIF